jgi:hypothetical protein
MKNDDAECVSIVTLLNTGEEEGVQPFFGFLQTAGNEAGLTVMVQSET